MLFARDNNVKLFRVFHALALQYPHMKFAKVAQKDAQRLEAKYARARCYNSKPLYLQPNSCVFIWLQVPHHHRQQGADPGQGPIHPPPEIDVAARLRQNDSSTPALASHARSGITRARLCSARALRAGPCIRCKNVTSCRFLNPTSSPPSSRQHEPTYSPCVTPLEASLVSYSSCPKSTPRYSTAQRERARHP
jgi:hypothetical protein